MKPLRIIIPGGSGQVGTLLARGLHARGHQVTVLTRQPAPPQPWRTLQWDARTPGPWSAELEGADALINLCGRNVNCRYTAANRREIMASRLDSTQLLGEVLERAARPPRVWLQASTATVYAHTWGRPQDELKGTIGGNEPDAPAGWRFSIEVAQAWEAAAQRVQLPRTRLVLMRSAMTMSADPGGVFALLLRLVRWRLGGRVGDGRQFVSWIHGEDFLRAVLWLIDQEQIAGPVNLAAPQPLPQREFMRLLRHAWGVRVGLPTPRPLLHVGAWVLRTEPELILKSRRVVPELLTRSGFTFDFPSWAPAAKDLCRRWRSRHRAVTTAP